MPCPFAPRRGKKDCPYYDKDSVTCNHPLEWKFCGKFKEYFRGE